MNKIRSIVLLAAVAAIPTAFAASSAALVSPQAGDEVATAITAAAPGFMRPAASIDHRPVSVSRALSPEQKLAAAPIPYVAKSREYWIAVDAAKLHRGVAVVTTAPGAVVRVSPVGGAAELDPADISVRPPAHAKSMRLRSASRDLAEAPALRAAGMAVADGALAFRFDSRLGSGRFGLIAPKADGRYLIHVLDPHSRTVLKLNANRVTALDGQPVSFALHIAGAGQSMSVASGLVTAPDGSSFPLEFRRGGDGSFHASFVPSASHSRGPELWQARAFVAVELGHNLVLRDARTAFAVSAPTARLVGDVAVDHADGGLRFEIGIDAAHASRYQLSGVLYGTAADGSMKPAALAQSAAWRTAGDGSLSLAFDHASIAKSGLGAPWQLRDLRLFDQGTMQLVERRGRALTVN